MKSILMSIRPEWCKKIFDGEKTIEVRKTRPLIDMPFKVYVYCTKKRMTRVPSMYAYLHKNEPGACAEYGTIETWGKIGDVIVNPHLASKHVSFGMHGKVIGEFVCDKVYKIVPDGEYYSNGYDIDDDMLSETCLGRGYLTGYGLGYTLYGWHITAPTLFDKPKDITEFALYGKCAEDCDEYDCCARDSEDGRMSCKYFKRTFLKRPPQSYCFVETDEK